MSKYLNTSSCSSIGVVDQDESSLTQSIREKIDNLRSTVNDIHKASQTPEARRKALRMWPTSIVLFTYLFVIAYCVPIYPTLILEAVEFDSSLAARWNGYSMVAKGILQLISSPVIGTASDMFGRKPFLVMCLLSLSLQIWILVFVGSNLTAIMCVRVLAGTSDSILTIVFAAITDITTMKEDLEQATADASVDSDEADDKSAPSSSSSTNKEGGTGVRKKDLSTNYGVVGAVFGVSFILGPVTGGIVSHFIDITQSLIIVGILATFMTIHTAARYKETLQEENRLEYIEPSKFSPIQPLMVVLKSDSLRSLCFPYLLYEIAFHVNTAWLLWVQYRFGWEILDVGCYLSVLGLSIAFFQAFVIRAIPKYLSEKKAIVYGYTSCCLYYCLAGFCYRGWMLYFLLTLVGYGSLAGPCLRATLSSHVADCDQGLLQGALDSITTIASIIAGYIFGIVLSWSEDNSDLHGVYGILSDGGINFLAALFLVPAIYFISSALNLYALKDESGPLVLSYYDDPQQQPNEKTTNNLPVYNNESKTTTTNTSTKEQPHAQDESIMWNMIFNKIEKENSYCDLKRKNKWKEAKRALKKIRVGDIMSDGRGLV